MFSVATLPLNSSVHQSRYMFFMPLFAYLLILFVMLVLSFLNFIQHSLEEETAPPWVWGPVGELTQLSGTHGSPYHCCPCMQLPSTATPPRGKTSLPSMTPVIRVTLFTPSLTMDIWHNALLHLAPFQNSYLSVILPSNVEGISWDFLEDILRNLSMLHSKSPWSWTPKTTVCDLEHWF